MQGDGLMLDRLKKIFEIAATAVVTVAAGLFLWNQAQARWLRPTPHPRVEDVHSLTLGASTIRYVEGTGRIALVEFTDYECPFCGQYAHQTEPTVEQQLVQTG